MAFKLGAFNVFLPQGFAMPVVVRKGIYVVHIRDWLSVFPRGQFLFLETEEARHRPDYTLLSLMDFLGTGKISHTFVFWMPVKLFSSGIAKHKYSLA